MVPLALCFHYSNLLEVDFKHFHSKERRMSSSTDLFPVKNVYTLLITFCLKTNILNS